MAGLNKLPYVNECEQGGEARQAHYSAVAVCGNVTSRRCHLDEPRPSIR
jgi:hypothetical protein